MSVKDLLEADLLPAFIIIFIVILIAIPAGIFMAKKSNNQLYGDDENGEVKTEKNAKLVSRRSSPHPTAPTVMVNKAVFELTNGSRLEFAIKNADVYGVMVEGDHGTLEYQGKRFIRFERDG